MNKVKIVLIILITLIMLAPLVLAYGCPIALVTFSLDAKQERRNGPIIDFLMACNESKFKIADAYFKLFPIPDYQKNNKSVSHTAICEKIRNEETRNLCFNTVNKSTEEKLDDFYYEINDKKEYCGYYGKNDRAHLRNSLSADLNASQYSKRHPHYLYHNQAILENPYFCDKMTFLTSFGADWYSKNACYNNASLFWRNPVLCQKTKDEDLCYFCLAIQESAY